jgi:hypothetical protein
MSDELRAHWHRILEADSLDQSADGLRRWIGAAMSIISLGSCNAESPALTRAAGSPFS